MGYMSERMIQIMNGEACPHCGYLYSVDDEGRVVCGRCAAAQRRPGWTWVQPRTREELLTRLAHARDLDVPARERENLCAAAYTEILGMPQTAAEQQLARAQHDIIVREAVVTYLEQHLAAATQQLEGKDRPVDLKE